MAGATDGAPRDLLLICTELNPALELLQELGLRLDVIYPADCPHAALLSHAGQTVRLTTQPDAPLPSDELPAFQPEFVFSCAGSASGEGRAGMHYRDLILSRLGGRYIASHITIAEGGPISDWVHYHRVAFQMIYVAKGWVRVVYEDQGEPFVMRAGDLVLQPPEIRHRVLESSPGLEVVEISCPALHETLADHDMALPNARVDSRRSFGGQRFLHHVAADMPWTPLHGMEVQETAVGQATGGLVKARTIRRGTSAVAEFPPHDGELMFGFVLDGSAHLHFGEVYPLAAADAFVIPPGEPWSLSDVSDDLRIFQVTTARMA